MTYIMDDLDSFLAEEMPPIDEACECCDVLVNNIDYIRELEKKREKERLEETEHDD